MKKFYPVDPVKNLFFNRPVNRQQDDSAANGNDQATKIKSGELTKTNFLN